MGNVSAKSVLVVDDEPSIRNLLTGRLEEAGFETRQAEDGIDGLMKLRDELPMVIISDLQMPRMTGIEFISVVRRRFPFIPVGVLSGAIPSTLPAEAAPDFLIDKGALQVPKLLQVLDDLIRKASDRATLPQEPTTPVRTLPGFATELTLTCPDCLRTFQLMHAPENKTLEQTAVCVHCQARVPFLIESAGSA